jgi:hypothetical protein
MAAEGGVVTRAFKRIVAGFKSVPVLVVRTIIATLLGTGDLASDVYSTVGLFRAGPRRPGERDGGDGLREHDSAGPGPERRSAGR